MRLAKLLLMAVVAIGLLSTAASASTVTFTYLCYSENPVVCGTEPCVGDWQLWATVSEGDNFGLAGYAAKFQETAIDVPSIINTSPYCPYDIIAGMPMGFTERAGPGVNETFGTQKGTVGLPSLVRGVGQVPGTVGSMCAAGGVQLNYGLGNASPDFPPPLPVGVELPVGSVLLATGTSSNCCAALDGTVFERIEANIFLDDSTAATAPADVINTVLATNCIVPEPSTWVLLIMGGLSLLIWRRRK